MRRSHLACLLAALVFPALASAQLSSGNIFFGYSHGSTGLSNNGNTGLNGWEGSLEGKIIPWVGIVADLNGQYGLSSSFPTSNGSLVHVSASEYNFLFGPRVSLTVKRFRPFAHVLVGVSHVGVSGNGYSASDTALGYALGVVLTTNFGDPSAGAFKETFCQLVSSAPPKTTAVSRPASSSISSRTVRNQNGSRLGHDSCRGETGIVRKLGLWQGSRRAGALRWGAPSAHVRNGAVIRPAERSSAGSVSAANDCHSEWL